MPNVIVRRSAIHGLGVFAVRDFFQDETVLLIDDSRTVDTDHPLREEIGEYKHHCDYLAGGRVVLLKSPERHINSSCNPNTFVRTIDGVRHVVARSFIRAGDEITYDYIINCHGGEVLTCSCGEKRCRGEIVSSFFELPIELQLEYLPLLDQWFIIEHQQEAERLRAARDNSQMETKGQ